MIRNPNEYRYFKTVRAIGVALIVFLLLLNTTGIVLAVLQSELPRIIHSEMWLYLITQTVYAGGYLLSFMLPVAFLKRGIIKNRFNYRPMEADLQFSPWLPVILFGGIVIIWTQFYLNSALVSIFNYSDFSADIIWNESNSMKNYEVAMQFIVMCLVPAFCEEFLFRGAILTNLLPFGRGTAILISSLLFGLMHQNAEQILYAFAAGLVLGAVYERTGSIWNCTFLHLMNNFASMAQGILADRLGGEQRELFLAITETAVFAIGMLCLPILIHLLCKKKRNVFKNGVFGVSVPEAETYVACPVGAKQTLKLFFNIPMIIFLSVCAVQIVLLLGMALTYAG